MDWKILIINLKLEMEGIVIVRIDLLEEAKEFDTDYLLTFVFVYPEIHTNSSCIKNNNNKTRFIQSSI